MERRFESAGLQSLYDEFVGGDPEMVSHFEHTSASLEISVTIRRLRTEAGLTMKELAARVGTQPSAIARLEHADYEGHSLSMLRRIAEALGRRVEIRFPRAEAGAPKHAKAHSHSKGGGVPKTSTSSAPATDDGGIGEESKASEKKGRS